PTGRKWEAVARQPARPRYLICNADESEPGTFKDRVLMEGDPFAVVESMTICAYATGCEQGFVYVRGEYPLAVERLQGAIDAARSARPRGRRGGRSEAAGDPPRRRGWSVRPRRRARHPAHLRGGAGRRGNARLGSGDGIRRLRRSAFGPAAHRGLLPRRILRP